MPRIAKKSAKRARIPAPPTCALLQLGRDCGSSAIAGRIRPSADRMQPAQTAAGRRACKPAIRRERGDARLDPVQPFAAAALARAVGPSDP